MHVLFEEFARSTAVQDGIDHLAPRWWRDQPRRRGLALYAMARHWATYDVTYADDAAQRFAAEFGGPVGRDVLADYLAEGPGATELVVKLWRALAKTTDRDALVAAALPAWLAHPPHPDAVASVLGLLRRRLCEEHDGAGIERMRAAIAGFAGAHADDTAADNAAHDFAAQRCGT
jgi:hypothetical protein